MDNDKKPPSPYDQALDLPGGDSRPAATHDFAPVKRRPRLKKPLIILVLLLLLGGLAYGGLHLLDSPQPATVADNEPVAKQPPAEKTPSTAELKTYTAETLAVEFKYPADWKVSEKDAGITVTAPDFEFPTVDGANQTGTFRIYIRNGARANDSKYIGRAVVIQPTEQLVYSQPNPNQRKQTELSFLGYDDTSSFAFVMITPGFKLQKGQTLGAKYGSEASAYIIAGGYSTAANKDDLSFQPVPTASFMNSTAYKQAIDILKSLKVS